MRAFKTRDDYINPMRALENGDDYNNPMRALENGDDYINPMRALEKSKLRAHKTKSHAGMFIFTQCAHMTTTEMKCAHLRPNSVQCAHCKIYFSNARIETKLRCNARIANFSMFIFS